MFINITEEESKNPWIKIVGMLQQNWALIIKQKNKVLIVFFDDFCGIFDEIAYDSVEDAKQSLTRNGFSLFNEDKEVQSFVSTPQGKFHEITHINGKIYSSGRYWIY